MKAVWIAYLIVMSIIAYILYAADKKRAKKGVWRIRERTLLLFGFFGGAAGALIAMETLRHKTKHTGFWIVNLVGLLWQAALTVYLVGFAA